MYGKTPKAPYTLHPTQPAIVDANGDKVLWFGYGRGIGRSDKLSCSTDDTDFLVNALSFHDRLVKAAGNLIGKIDALTTAEFSVGGEQKEREALRKVLDEIKAQAKSLKERG